MGKAHVLTHEERLALTKGLYKRPEEVKPEIEPEPEIDRWDFRRTNKCPLCGAELLHISGCVNCSQCEWSAC